MLPLRDDVPARGVPTVVLALVAANLGLFAYELVLAARAEGAPLESLVHAWGLVPRDLLRAAGEPGAAAPWVWATPLTSLFLHAGWVHLGGNLLYLWIFGTGVEGLLGHARFALFYLVCGLAAGVAHVASAPDSFLPTVGASGAVSGVLGAYLLGYPRARLRVLVPAGPLWAPLGVPALLFGVAWLALQLAAGLGRLGGAGAGVAWWAHVGGFATGAVLAGPLRLRAPLRRRRV